MEKHCEMKSHRKKQNSSFCEGLSVKLKVITYLSFTVSFCGLHIRYTLFFKTVIVQSELLFQKYKLLLTAFSVRSHWKIISRIWVRIVLFALARSIFLLPASAMQFSYWPWASSAYPKQWTENSIRTEKKCAQKNYCPYQIMPQNIDTSYFFCFHFSRPPFVKPPLLAFSSSPAVCSQH